MDFSGQTNVNTSTNQKVGAKTVETVLNASPLTLYFLGNQKSWAGWGAQVKIPVAYSTSSEGQAFDGLERFNRNKETPFVNMTFDPTGYEQPIVISGIEQDVNATNPAVNLKKRQTQWSAMQMANSIASLFYTAQSGKNFLSLVDATDDGSDVTTYGGLARATYSGIAGNVTSSVGTITRAAMRTMYNSCTHGADSPDMLATDKTTWGYIEQIVTAANSNQIPTFSTMGYPQFIRTGKVVPSTQGLAGQTGFDAIYFAGKPVVYDEKCTSGYLYFINTKHIAFYGVPTTNKDFSPIRFGGDDTMDSVYSAPVTTGFSISNFTRPNDQYGESADIILVGNLIADSPRHLGVLEGITGA